MPVYHRIVATAGTSAFAATNVPRRWLDEHAKELLSWERVRPIPRHAEAVDSVLAAWRSALPIVSDPKAVSAEYSAIHALRARKHLGPGPTVVLIRSHTDDGRLAAEMVRPLLERDFSAHVEIRCVGDLDAEQPALMRRSLGAFMQQVGDALRGGDPHSTCFAPLGGYKVMTSLGYVAGAFLRFPTAYLHEGSQLLHEIPWVPIQVDEAELRRLAPLIRRTVGGIAASALSESERRAVDQHTWLFERAEDGGDELIFLNAFGHFLRGDPRYRAAIGTCVRASAEVRKECEEPSASCTRAMPFRFRQRPRPYRRRSRGSSRMALPRAKVSTNSMWPRIRKSIRGEVCRCDRCGVETPACGAQWFTHRKKP